MSDELTIKRIINLPEATSLSDGDCFMVDNENSTAKKIDKANFMPQIEYDQVNKKLVISNVL